MNQRVRYDWYRRWLEQPQRMQPGTRMPTVFTDGKSLLDKVLDGDADAQAEAMWAYLSLGPEPAAARGMEPPKGLVLAVKDRPVLLRTFMPDAGTRAVAVGYPGGVSVAFDAATCRLAYAWSGNFLDASPVWDGRGGSPAKVLGPSFWTAPPGCPWEVGTAPASRPTSPPGRRTRPTAPPLPEGKVFTGPPQLRFEGYTTDQPGCPTFRYLLHAGTDAAVGGDRAIRSRCDHRPASAWRATSPCRCRRGRPPGCWPARRGRSRAHSMTTGSVAAARPEGRKLWKLPADGPVAGVAAGRRPRHRADTGGAPEGSRWLLRRQGTAGRRCCACRQRRRPGDREVRFDVWVAVPRTSRHC